MAEAGAYGLHFFYVTVYLRAGHSRRLASLPGHERSFGQGSSMHSALTQSPCLSLGSKFTQDTLSGRDSIVDEHRAAAKSTISKRRAIEKMKSSASIKGDRVDEALDELDEVRRSRVCSQLSPIR